MSNGVLAHSQFKGSTFFTLKEPVLEHASFVTIRKGDLTAQFSGFAQKLMHDFKDVDVEITIEKTTHTGHQRLTVRRTGPGAQALTSEQMESFKNYVDSYLANYPLIDEEAMLDWSEQVQDFYRKAHGEYSNMADWYVREKLVPDRAQATGDDVGIGFAGFVPDGAGGTLIGMTLSNGCKSCQTSYMKTLKVGNDKTADFIQNQHAPEETIPKPDNFQGILVLPDRNGSPSMTFRRRPDPLTP